MRGREGRDKVPSDNEEEKGVKERGCLGRVEERGNEGKGGEGNWAET